MGKKLAIRGHSTRGNEVIALLEMFGGKNIRKLDGTANMYSYYLIDNLITSDRLSIAEDDDFEIFTLQCFLEKFPFKIHDLVNIPEYESTVGICGMRWDPYSKYVEYMVYRCDDEEWYTAEELLEWNDNPNNTSKNMEEKKINQMSLANCDLDEVEIVLGDKFELKIEDGKYYAVRKKSKYPTTYDECSAVLNLQDSMIQGRRGYEWRLISYFQQLLMCRDAYWKIAGEEMGLDRPWNADFTQGSGIKYIICFANGEVIWNRPECECVTGSRVLAFPTKEMRNAFYENFKYLIEACKELL